MDSEVALYFRDEFREARAAALEDAEGYQQILFVLERFGSYMFGGGCYEEHEHSEESRGLDDISPKRGCCALRRRGSGERSAH